MALDVSPPIGAVSRLEEALDLHRRDPSQAVIRDGLVQRFELKRMTPSGASLPLTVSSSNPAALPRTECQLTDISHFSVA
jgi:hypothetical protein